MRLLIRGHLRSRWKRYLVLSIALGVGLAGFLGTLMVINGARDALIQPLSSTLTGPLRVTQETRDLGAGRMWNDTREIQGRLSELSGGTVVERLESNYLTIRGEDFERWSAGLLVGIDPDRDSVVADPRPYLVWGHALPGDFVFDEDGKGHVPILIGKPATKRLNLTLNQTGRPDFEHPLTLTSGHLVDTGGAPVPLTLEAVVVGVFETGLEPLDKFSAFVPIRSARYLAGFAENDPVANTFLIDTEDAQGAAARIRSELHLEAVTAPEFAFDYMGSMLVVLYAATVLGVGLFVVVFLVWLVHETGGFIRSDEPVICSLRAIGVHRRTIERSYVGLTTGAVAAGATGAVFLAAVVAPFLPPVQWHLSGLSARIGLRVDPLLALGLALGSVFVAWVASYATARRIARFNILAGLRKP